MSTKRRKLQYNVPLNDVNERIPEENDELKPTLKALKHHWLLSTLFPPQHIQSRMVPVSQKFVMAAGELTLQIRLGYLPTSGIGLF